MSKYLHLYIFSPFSHVGRRHCFLLELCQEEAPKNCDQNQLCERNTSSLSTGFERVYVDSSPRRLESTDAPQPSLPDLLPKLRTPSSTLQGSTSSKRHSLDHVVSVTSGMREAGTTYNWNFADVFSAGIIHHMGRREAECDSQNGACA